LDFKASLPPVVADESEKPFLSFPKMSAPGDVAEQGFGISTLFQTDERRESLKVESQVTKGRSVPGQIGGKKESSG
jgi:hypothetical protein